MTTEFSQLLARLMRAKGISQYRLGVASNLGPDTICRLLKGKRRPTERHALRISAVIFMDPWQLDAINDVLQAADAYIFPPPHGLRWQDGDEQSPLLPRR